MTLSLIKYTVHTRVRERTPTRTESGKGPTRGLAKNTSLAPHRVCDRSRRAARGSTKYRQGELLVLPAPVPAAPAIRYRSRRLRRLGWLGWRRRLMAGISQAASPAPPVFPPFGASTLLTLQSFGAPAIHAKHPGMLPAWTSIGRKRPTAAAARPPRLPTPLRAFRRYHSRYAPLRVRASIGSAVRRLAQPRRQHAC